MNFSKQNMDNISQNFLCFELFLKARQNVKVNSICLRLAKQPKNISKSALSSKIKKLIRN